MPRDKTTADNPVSESPGPDGPAAPTVAIVHGFNNACGGTENEALQLARLLAPYCEVELWALGEPDPGLAAQFPIRRISLPRWQFPRGAHIVLPGASRVGWWAYFSRPGVVSLIANTLTPERLVRRVRRWKRVPKQALKVFYVSEAQRQGMSFPGEVMTSPVDIERFAPVTTGHAGLRAGRLSRDVDYKHGTDDPALYRELVGQGWQVSLQGATCLEPQLGDAPGIELLPETPDAPEAFLQSLDVFFYRTRDDWYEAFGRVVLEALACGVVVIAEQRGGYAELIEHGSNGFLFETSAEALGYFRQLQDDPALLAQMKQAARESALSLVSADSGQAFMARFTQP